MLLAGANLASAVQTSPASPTEIELCKTLIHVVYGSNPDQPYDNTTEATLWADVSFGPLNGPNSSWIDVMQGETPNKMAQRLADQLKADNPTMLASPDSVTVEGTCITVCGTWFSPGTIDDPENHPNQEGELNESAPRSWQFEVCP